MLFTQYQHYIIITYFWHISFNQIAVTLQIVLMNRYFLPSPPEKCVDSQQVLLDSLYLLLDRPERTRPPSTQ